MCDSLQLFVECFQGWNCDTAVQRMVPGLDVSPEDIDNLASNNIPVLFLWVEEVKLFGRSLSCLHFIAFCLDVKLIPLSDMNFMLHHKFNNSVIIRCNLGSLYLCIEQPALVTCLSLGTQTWLWTCGWKCLGIPNTLQCSYPSGSSLKNIRNTFVLYSEMIWYTAPPGNLPNWHNQMKWPLPSWPLPYLFNLFSRLIWILHYI